MTIAAAIATLPPRTRVAPASATPGAATPGPGTPDSPTPDPRTPDAAPRVGRPATTTPWWDRRSVGVALVLLLAVVSAAVFTAGITTPWPWGDEGATYLAMQRDWTQLTVLFAGPDAPNVPYYFVAKAWTTLLQVLWPAGSTLVSLRLLSATAAGLTAVALYALVARRAGRLAGVFAGLVLISLPGFSRYAQEARTYTLLTLLATVSWLLWDRWLQPRRPPTLTHGGPVREAVPGRRTPGLVRTLGYGLSLGALAVLHTFGLFQWPAHALATLTAPGSLRSRLRRVAGLVVALVLAAGIAVSQVLDSLRYGTGPTGVHRFRVVDAASVLDLFVRAISWTPDPSVLVPVLGLAVVGVLTVLSRERRAFVASLLIWLVVPLAGAITLGALQTNLFRYRYWIAFLPPLAALAGLGLAALAVLPVRLATRASGVVLRGHASAARRTGALAGAVVALALLWLQASVVLPAQLAVRAPLGHGEDLGGAIAALDSARARYPGVTAVFTAPFVSGMFGALDPALEKDNPLLWVDPAATTVYTSPTSPEVARQRLAADHTLIWILPGQWTARQALRKWPADAGPRPHVVSAAPAGRRFTAVLLTR